MHSSQTISFASVNIFALADPLLTLHTRFSDLVISNGSLNAECAVRPLDRRVAAIPEEAAAIAIDPSSLTLDNTKFSRNVFPVPPGASRKTQPEPC